MAKLRITAGRKVFEVALEDTPSARAVLDALPFEASARTWGEEVYFEAPVSVDLETDARQTVEPGTVCFWVEGSALALPYGPTPLSGADGKPQLVSPCNVLGRVLGEPRLLAQIPPGERLKVEKA